MKDLNNKFSIGEKYICTAPGMIFVRKLPDDNSPSISGIRPNQEVICNELREGIINPVDNDEIRTDNVWMKVNDLGYVRTVDISGERLNFSLNNVEFDYPTSTKENVGVGGVIMVKPNSTNAYGMRPKDSESFYAPNKHEVIDIDPSGDFLFLKANADDDGTWYKMQDCVTVDPGERLGK